jgi:predicted RNase H-like nuclease
VIDESATEQDAPETAASEEAPTPEPTDEALETAAPEEAPTPESSDEAPETVASEEAPTPEPSDEAPEARRRRARRRRRHVPRFLGLDLAWAPRKSSGGAVMELSEDGGARLVSSTALRTHEDILGWIARNRGRAGCVLAVNAPLIVENTSGRRPCDDLLHDHFGEYNVDEYQVNTVNASHPRTIGRALMRMGFDPNPMAEGDRVVETYNQAAQVLLFGGERPVRLKSGPVGARKDAVARFREALWDRLGDSMPHLEETPALDAILEADLPSSNGSRVGELEERLEATLSAYTATYLGMRGPESCAFLGDLETGYVLLPTTPQPPGE